MRPLNKNERRLLTLTLLVIGGASGLSGWDFISRQRKALKEQYASLKAEETVARDWLAEEALWLERKQWLDGRQPRMAKSANDHCGELLFSLQQSAQAAKVTVTEPRYLNPSAKGARLEVGVGLRATGTLEAVARWLAEVQQPQNFQAITYFSMKSASEPPQVKCDLQVFRYFAPAETP